MFGVCDFWKKPGKSSKVRPILASCYPRNFDWFSRGWSKKMFSAVNSPYVSHFGIFLVHPHENQSKLGWNFDDYPSYQPKITHPKYFWPKCKYVYFFSLQWMKNIHATSYILGTIYLLRHTSVGQKRSNKVIYGWSK